MDHSCPPLTMPASSWHLRLHRTQERPRGRSGCQHRPFRCLSRTAASSSRGLSSQRSRTKDRAAFPHRFSIEQVGQRKAWSLSALRNDMFWLGIARFCMSRARVRLLRGITSDVVRLDRVTATDYNGRVQKGLLGNFRCSRCYRPSRYKNTGRHKSGKPKDEVE